MEVKLFEIRDRMTFFAVVAVSMKPTPAHEDIYSAERFLLRSAGYAVENYDPTLIAVGRADADGRIPFCYDPHSWRDSRTMRVAHLHIQKHWSTLRSGDVVDVEFILGETKSPKISERLTRG